MWIKLHFYHNGEEVFVRSQHISAVYTDQRKGYRDTTIVQLMCDNESYLQVNETVDEVIEKIEKAESEKKK